MPARKPTRYETLALYKPPPPTEPQLQLLEWQELMELLAGCENISSVEEIREGLRIWRQEKDRR